MLNMSDDYFDYYDGSRVFLPVANFFGVQVDLLNFLIAQLTALGLARLFRKSLRRASEDLRHATCLVLGLFMGYFCFGRQSIHMAVLPTLVYIIIRTVNTRAMANIVLAVSMAYLSCLHVHRQIYHSADYSLDITGPLMVITQRVTSLAYSLQDGLNQTSDGKARSKELIPIRVTPTILEFFAYTLAFQTIMCGPAVFYNDYINFIKGTQYMGISKESDSKMATIVNEPSPRGAVAYKVFGAFVAAILYLKFVNLYPIHQLRDLMDPSSEVSQTWSTPYLLWFAYVSTAVVRCKYYHAWLLADAICNNCGIGFNGYDDAGKPKWDRVSNVDVFGFELAQNFRTAVSSWNRTTNTWLRAVAYRPGRLGTLRVYALSAIWHGFQPGYYLTFFTGGVFTIAARKVRTTVRPLFVSTRIAFVYHAVTFLTTRLTMTYATVPFVMLQLGPCLAFYARFYYSFHVVALAAIFIPFKQGAMSREDSQSSVISSTPIYVANGDAKIPYANGTSNGSSCTNNNGKVKCN